MLREARSHDRASFVYTYGMAVTVTPVGNPTVFGNKHVRIADLTFTGNYTNEGEPLTAEDLGFANEVEWVAFDGAIAAADGETAIVPKYDYTNAVVMTFEGSAAGTALSEKTGAEAYPTDATVRVVALGY